MYRLFETDEKKTCALSRIRPDIWWYAKGEGGVLFTEGGYS